jgi:hypothetical protein
VIAAFIVQSGLSADLVHAELMEIDRRHEELGYAPPARSTPALAALNSVHPIPAPRSWRADEVALFESLPHGVKVVLARRESERDRALSKCQNDAAQWRKLKEKSNVDEKAKVA